LSQVKRLCRCKGGRRNDYRESDDIFVTERELTAKRRQPTSSPPKAVREKPSPVGKKTESHPTMRGGKERRGEKNGQDPSRLLVGGGHIKERHRGEVRRGGDTRH